MKRIALYLVLLLLASPLAVAQTQTTSARVQDGHGQPLISGASCFTSATLPSPQPLCVAVAQGAFTLTVPSDTYTYTVQDGSGALVLTLSNVVVSGSTWNLDTYPLPPAPTPSAPSGFGLGDPYVPCAAGATYTRSDPANPALNGWTCTSTNGSTIWFQTGSGLLPPGSCPGCLTVADVQALINASLGNVVESVNSAHANVTIQGGGATTVSTVGQTITVSSTGLTPGKRLPASSINQSLNTHTFVIGDSIGAGAGASSTATQWPNVFYTMSGVGTLTNDAFAGFVIADTQNFGLLGVHPGGAPNADLDRSYNQQPFASGLTLIYNADNDDGFLDGPSQIAYQQQFLSTIALAGTASAEWVVPYNTSVVTTGTVVQDNFAPPLPAIEVTSPGGTITYPSFQTTGNPIYWIFPVFPAGDGGSFSISIDGGPPAVDTITGSATIANTPFGGTPLRTSQGYTQTYAAARFPVPAGTHSVSLTCPTPGVHGCGLAALLTPPINPTEWGIPTVAVAGDIIKLNNSNPVGTALYDGINKSLVALTSADGFNSVFADVRSFIPLYLNGAAMAATDGFGPQAIVRSNITFTAGQPVITSSVPFSQVYDGMQAFCLNAATSTTTLYTTVSNSGFNTNIPTQLTLMGKAGVSSGAGTGTCWFGWPGQIWRASTNPGLHPNDFGHQLIARAFLGALQPVTVPPAFNNYTSFLAGASINCATKGPSDCTFSLGAMSNIATAPVPRIDFLGAAGIQANSIAQPFYAPDSNIALAIATEGPGTSFAVGYMSTPVNQLQNYVFPFEFSGLRGLTSKLPIRGQQLIQTNGETVPGPVSAYVLVVGTAGVSPGTSPGFAGETLNLVTNTNFYFPSGFSSQAFDLTACQGATPFTLTPQTGITAITQTTAGSGQTPGVYVVPAVGGGGTGATVTITVGSTGTASNALLSALGTGYTSAPTFTNTAAGGTPSTTTGIPSAPVFGFYFQNGGVVDATPNSCSTQTYHYLPSKAAWYADGFYSGKSATAAASNCNQSGVLTSVAGCRVEVIGGVTHYVPYF